MRKCDTPILRHCFTFRATAATASPFNHGLTLSMAKGRSEGERRVQPGLLSYLADDNVVLLEEHDVDIRLIHFDEGIDCFVRTGILRLQFQGYPETVIQFVPAADNNAI